MESHEEKLLAMVQESKMNQAKEIMKQKENILSDSAKRICDFIENQI